MNLPHAHSSFTWVRVPVRQTQCPTCGFDYLGIFIYGVKTTAPILRLMKCFYFQPTIMGKLGLVLAVGIN